MTPSRAVTPHDSDALRWCGARTRPGAKFATCRRPAGWGTPHVGEGKCKLHGGLTPVKSGRYSSVKHERLRTLIEEQAAHDDPLNTLPELAAARALFVDFIERYDETTAALLAWHADWQATRRPIPEDLKLAFERVVDEYENRLREDGESTEKELEAVAASRKFIAHMRGLEQGGKPHTVLDLSDAYRIVGEVTKIAERIEKARAANAVSRADLTRILQEMGRAVDLHVEDGQTKQRIKEAWLAIRL